MFLSDLSTYTIDEQKLTKELNKEFRINILINIDFEKPTLKGIHFETTILLFKN